MGHQAQPPMPPIDQRRPCPEHETYSNTCFGCHLFNGGGDD